ADPLEDPRDLALRAPRRHPVEPCRVREVLLGRHLLEEARLDRDAVDEPAHGARLLERVVPEHASLAALVQKQRRQEPYERRLARAVLAQDRDALAACDRERDVLDGDASPRADALLPADELLAQIVNLDCVHLLLRTRRRETKRAHRRVIWRRAARPESAEEQHRRPTIANECRDPQVFLDEIAA